MKAKLLLLAVVALALAGCGSSGITIPQAGNRTLEQGYALLRSKGFRVSLSNAGWRRGTFGLSTSNGLEIWHIVPAPGTRVAPGSVVTLVPYHLFLGDLTTDTHPKHYRLPDFAGRSPAVAMRWADRRYVYWDIHHLPQLHAATARNFFAAYVVTGQHPAAGKLVRETGWLALTVRPRR